uniref:Uncharacterized protein n=1 Tax=Trypanosoma vivax (strain Y486) TaxID=1055687 RepID=G0TWN6_TRYVY|nr:hypothetical protein, conserved in T. vivax [Trypanosoma vivax Y486]
MVWRGTVHWRWSRKLDAQRWRTRMDTHVAREAMPLGGGEYSRSTWHSTLRWCQLLWNVKKGPGKKTRPMTATGSNAPGVRRSVPHTRGRGSTWYRNIRRSSYRAAPRRFRMHPTATARQSRRTSSKRNLYASSAIASSRARHGSPGTNANQPLSQTRKARTWQSSRSQQRVPFAARSATIGGCCGIC